MSVFRPIQHSFTSGEISPLFYAQQDAPLYQTGLKRCRNMIPLTQGGCTSRPGTGFIMELDPAETEFQPTNARCVPIELNQEDWSVLVMGGGSAVLVNNANIVSDQQVVKNPDFDDGLTDWLVVRQGGAGTNGSARPETIQWDEATVETIRVEAFLVILPPVATVMSLRQEATAVAGDQDMSFEYRLGHHASNQNNVTFQVQVSKDDFQTTPIYDQFHSIPANEVDTIRVDLPGTTGYSGPLFITIDMLGADFPSIGHVHYCRCWSRNVSAIPPDAFITPYTDDELEQVQFVSNPFVQSTVFVHPAHPPQELVLDTGVWTWQEIDFDHQGPGREPEWGEGNGWPSACSSFQGRLILAGSPGEPQAVWSSAPGDWYEVDQPDEPPTADNPVWWTLSSRGSIRWVHGQKALLHGTSVAEHQVQAAGGAVLQAGNIQAVKQSGYGSTAIQPADTGELVAFVGGDGLRVRGIMLDRDVLGWRTDNLSWSAPHITEPGVRRIANSRDPYQILWAPLRNGALAAFSYEATYDLKGWHRHTTQGSFMDVCNARFGNSDFTFFVVRREVNGESKYYLEALQDLAQGESLRYMDSFKRQHFGNPVTLVDGLEHLEGLEVGIVADGLVQAPKLVLDGEITLDTAASDVTVGLLYLAEMETLPAISPGNVGGLAAMKSWAEIGVRMEDSRAPIVNGIRQDEGEDDVRMVELGWDLYATILVAQDLPVPLTVTGIYGRLSTEDIIG
jgi:hypothetical protein